MDQTPIQNGGKSQLEPTLDCLTEGERLVGARSARAWVLLLLLAQ